MSDTWKEYYYVCNKCDASITIITKAPPRVKTRCTCGIRIAWVTLISVEDLGLEGVK